MFSFWFLTSFLKCAWNFLQIVFLTNKISHLINYIVYFSSQKHCNVSDICQSFLNFHIAYKTFYYILTANESNCLQEFFSPLDTVFVDQDNSITLDLHYLPFKMGKRYCVIILINEQVNFIIMLTWIKVTIVTIRMNKIMWCNLNLISVKLNSNVKNNSIKYAVYIKII